MGLWKNDLVKNAHHFDFPIHKPIYQLSKEQYNLLWTGNRYFEGLNAFFKHLEENSYKIQYRVMLSRYRGKTPCTDCDGSRLRKDANYVKVGKKSITELVLLPVENLLDFFTNLNLSEYDKTVGKRLLIEITNRLQFLLDVGLGYLTLNRLSNSLSGGESQRINLATSLGSSLVGSTYILDEPSIGLHSRDTQRLIKVLKSLQKQGNTVLVVEHDEDIMHAADQLIDLGPEAGTNGGHLVYQGPTNTDDNKSLTLGYLSGRLKIEIPAKRRTLKKKITVEGARENNLKNINANFPLGGLVCVTGVSGSGKSTLVGKILYPALQRHFGGYGDVQGEFDQLSGDLKYLNGVEFINQNPIGKSSRSNPVTYIKAYDEIRSGFAALPISKLRGFKPSSFSFNVDGGRCDTCKGEGTVTVEMQFMADIQLQCETCKGKRFKDEVLEAKIADKNISDILDLTIDDAIQFFNIDCKLPFGKKIAQKLMPLQEVGLGYVQLGQASSTLSGGEAQRIKLASFLTKGENDGKIFFIFDEPTTGLHFHDIKKLLHAFDKLIEKGHSILVIEHNLDVVKCADYVIDLGPEGGEKGGNLVFNGTVEEMIKSKNSFTGSYLKTTVEKTLA
jgi:excinuclease ABC subunit A